MTIGENIKLSRKAKNLTQSELAEQLGVSMQAVSKWETDSGMPDISQLVPLARVLDISADKLLGLVGNDESEAQAVLSEIKKLRSNYPHGSKTPLDVHKEIFDIAYSFFKTHPNNPEIADWCLRSINELIAANTCIWDKVTTESECERFQKCIIRYATDADIVCGTYYRMARLYRMIGKEEKALECLDKLPFVFGDRFYWEAEAAMSVRDFETALSKCKESFSHMVRYISRSIRIVAQIAGGTGDKQREIELNEYMLRVINAFISDSENMPYRQIYQKTSLLSWLIHLHIQAGEYESAIECLEMLIETGIKYIDFLEHKKNNESLLLISESCEPADNVKQRIVLDYVLSGFSACKKCTELDGNKLLDACDEKMKSCGIAN